MVLLQFRRVCCCALALVLLHGAAESSGASGLYSLKVLDVSRGWPWKYGYYAGMTSSGQVIFQDPFIGPDTGQPYLSHRFIGSSNRDEDVIVRTPVPGSYQMVAPDGDQITFSASVRTSLMGKEAYLSQANTKGQAIAQIYDQGRNAQGSESRPVLVEGDRITEMISARPKDAVLRSAVGINESGTVVGNGVYRPPGASWDLSDNYGYRSSAYIYEEGSVRFLGSLPGFFGSEAYDINDKGQIVGMAIPYLGDPTPSDRGFLYEDGLMFDLDAMVDPESKGDWVISRALGINEEGVIAAIGIDPNYEYLKGGFLGSLVLLTPLEGSVSEPPIGTPIPPADPTPVPEPAPIIAFGLLAVGLMLRRGGRWSLKPRIG